ncbi:MAG: HAMP domain-containing sensor histidine kinase [Chloroflexota bacterium]
MFKRPLISAPLSISVDKLLAVLRWAAIGVIFLLSWLNPERPTHIALILATYNGLVEVAKTRVRLLQSPRGLFAVDTAVVSLLIFWGGGLDSPAYIIYYFSVITLALDLSLVEATMATVALGLVYAGTSVASGGLPWDIANSERLAGRLSILFIISVVSSMLKKELELERTLAARLKELEQMKTDFLSTVSHELKTPLTTIKASAELLLAGGPGPLNPTQERLTRNMARNIERLSALVGDLLDMARLDEGKLSLSLQRVDLNEVIKDAAAAVAPLAESRGQRMQVNYYPDPAPVVADRRRVEQVLINLLSNAHKFTPPGGHFALEVQEAGPNWLVSVSDNGLGIPRDELEHIFDRFYRGTEHKGGTGLGLSIAKSLIELHGGKIWVESKVGKGSTFSVSLPKESPGAYE